MALIAWLSVFPTYETANVFKLKACSPLWEKRDPGATASFCKHAHVGIQSLASLGLGASQYNPKNLGARSLQGTRMRMRRQQLIRRRRRRHQRELK